MDTLKPSRRALIGALALAPVAIGAAVPSLTLIATASPFSAALGRYRAAKAVEDEFDRLHLAPAALAAKHAEEAVPHVSLEVAGSTRTTHRWQDVDRCERLTRALYSPGRAPSEACRQAQSLVDAADARKRAVDALPETMRWEAVSRRSDELGDASYAAREEALAAPVGSMAELGEKLALIEQNDLFDHRDALGAFKTDLARLAAGGLN